MKVLVVSFSAPPQTTPRSMRVAAVVTALRAAGHTVELLQGDAGGNDEHLLARLGDTPRFAVPLGPLHRARQSTGAGPRGPAARRSAWSRWLRAQVRLLAYPDIEVEWLLGFARFRPPIQRPDLVVSVVFPFSGAVLGHWLAWRFGVPHVVDYGDPWSHRAGAETHPTRARVDRSLESAIVRAAAGIVVNTEDQNIAMRRWFPDARQVATFTNGYFEDDFPAPAEPDPTVLRHVGHLYAGRAEMGPAFDALARDRSFERIENVGQVDHVVLPPRIHVLPPVPFRDALGLQQSAGAVLVLGVPGGLQVPSKFFHALGTGRPVLFVAAPNDAVRRLGGWDPDQVVIVENAMADILAGLAEVRARAHRRFQPPAQYRWEAIGSAYVGYLEALVAGGRNPSTP